MDRCVGLEAQSSAHHAADNTQSTHNQADAHTVALGEASSVGGGRGGTGRTGARGRAGSPGCTRRGGGRAGAGHGAGRSGSGARRGGTRESGGLDGLGLGDLQSQYCTCWAALGTGYPHPIL